MVIVLQLFHEFSIFLLFAGGGGTLLKRVGYKKGGGYFIKGRDKTP